MKRILTCLLVSSLFFTAYNILQGCRKNAQSLIDEAENAEKKGGNPNSAKEGAEKKEREKLTFSQLKKKNTLRFFFVNSSSAERIQEASENGEVHLDPNGVSSLALRLNTLQVLTSKGTEDLAGPSELPASPLPEYEGNLVYRDKETGANGDFANFLSQEALVNNILFKNLMVNKNLEDLNKQLALVFEDTLAADKDSQNQTYTGVLLEWFRPLWVTCRAKLHTGSSLSSRFPEKFVDGTGRETVNTWALDIGFSSPETSIATMENPSAYLNFATPLNLQAMRVENFGDLKVVIPVSTMGVCQAAEKSTKEGGIRWINVPGHDPLLDPTYTNVPSIETHAPGLSAVVVKNDEKPLEARYQMRVTSATNAQGGTLETALAERFFIGQRTLLSLYLVNSEARGAIFSPMANVVQDPALPSAQISLPPVEGIEQSAEGVSLKDSAGTEIIKGFKTFPAGEKHVFSGSTCADKRTALRRVGPCENQINLTFEGEFLQETVLAVP